MANKKQVEVEIRPTSIQDMLDRSQGAIVELPPFSDGGKVYVKIRRPSMLSLVRAKKIPNRLLSSANKMFKSGPASLNTEDESMMDDIFSIMDVICEAALVEPTYKEIKEAGIELTDDQLMFIVGYTQNGVKQLESFRTK